MSIYKSIASAAKEGPDFVISTRTSAESIDGLDEASKRIKAHEQAWANVVGVALSQARYGAGASAAAFLPAMRPNARASVMFPPPG